jgi:succinate dehydrogenase / fumarate reductase, flavoprotein subunit
MYHQFMQLANLDITKEPMEIGPTTHYIMGGIRVNGDTQMSNVPGLLRRANAPPDCTARTGSAEIRFPTLLVFGKRAGEYAAKFAKENRRGQDQRGAGRGGGAPRRWSRSTAAPGRRQRRGPVSGAARFAGHDAGLVGIVRREEEMVRALDGIGKLSERAGQGRRARPSRIQSRLAHGA